MPEELRELIRESLLSNKATLDSNREVITKLGKDRKLHLILTVGIFLWIITFSVFGFLQYRSNDTTNRLAVNTSELAISNKNLLDLALPILQPTTDQAKAAQIKTDRNIDCIVSKVLHGLDPNKLIKDGC